MNRFDFVLATIGVVALLMLPIASLSQEPSTPVSEVPGPDVLEEVVVYGDVPLLVLRSEMDLAIDSYFAKFNELNSTDEFDIHCEREIHTGTRIKQRQCRARFYSDLEAQAAREWRDFGGPPPQQWLASRQVLIQRKAQLLDEEMKTLIDEHPELLEALTKAGAAEEKYSSERARRCAGRVFICSR